MTLRLNGTSSGFTEIDAPAAAGSNKITLPTSNGSAEQFLKNSGTAGELEFSSMVETSTGIGIGTSAPTHELHISGSGDTRGLITSGGSGDAVMMFENASGNTWGHGLDLSSGNYAIAYNSSGDPSLTADGKVNIDTSGRFLLGTSSSRGANFNNGSGVDSQFLLEGTSFVTSFANIVRNSNNANSAGFALSKSRGTSVGSNTIVQDGDKLGEIAFQGADGAKMVGAADIECQVDGTPGTGDMPGRLVFSTTADGASSSSERMKIAASGRISMAHDGSYYNAGLTLSMSGSNNTTTFVGRNTNASFSQDLHYYYVSRSSNSTFDYIKFAASAGSDNDFVCRGDGNAYADGSWNGGGADYAEYFEWSDGNTEAEDRRGISVVLDGDKIREAVAGEEPIGVISGNPSVVGDADIDRWKGKYLRDDFGTYIQDTHNVVEWNETITDSEGNQSTKKHSYEDWNIPDGIVVPDNAVVSATNENGQPYTHRRLNPDYNPDTAYISREDRAEWDTVGLMGKLRIRKGQVTGTRWIKMRDVSDTVEEWLVR